MEVAPRYALFIRFTVLHCLNSSMYAYIYSEARLERYWKLQLNY